MWSEPPFSFNKAAPHRFPLRVFDLTTLYCNLLEISMTSDHCRIGQAPLGCREDVTMRRSMRFLGGLSAASFIAGLGFITPVLGEATTMSRQLSLGPVIEYPWHTSRAELLSLVDRALSIDDAFYGKLESAADQAVAAAAAADHTRIRAIQNRERDSVAALPDGPTVRYIPLQTLVAGSGPSIPGEIAAQASGAEGFSVYTYYSPSTAQEAGFIVSFFGSAPGSPYTVGLSAAVRTDLEGPSTRSNPPWQDGGGLPLYVYICVQGNCSWQTQSADLQILDQNQTICYPSGVCVLAPPCDPTVNCARKHVSLWDSTGPLSNGEGFSVGDAHHDIPGHACPDDWDGVRDIVGNSVPLNDIYQTSYTDSGNAGTVACPPGYTPAYHNGLEYNVWVNGVG